MRRLGERTARHGLAYAVAIVLCLGPAVAGVHAQEAAPAGIASSGETVLLRESPGYDAAVLANVPDGSALEVSGAPMPAADGSSWLPVVIGGQSGYVPAGYVAQSAPVPVTESAPVADASAWLPAAPAEAAAPVADPAAPVSEPVTDSAVPVAAPAAAPLSSSAITSTGANLRGGPSEEAAIVQVLPPGSPVSIDGAAENGFVPVTGNGVSGWLSSDLLSEGTASTLPPPLVASDTTVAPEPVAAAALIATVPADTSATAPLDTLAPAPVVSSDQSTGIVWPFAGGEWEVVQGYNNGTHTNRSGFAQYKYSLDWARVDGNTAGQPVFAPVSGTIEWTDRGSGGMLIDAGNGYGVALFHVTIDRRAARGGSVERGQQIGTVSGPGGDGYESMAHIDMTCWRLTNGGHEAVPFTGPNAIAGQEFPDAGGGNQYMGAKVAP